MRVAILLGCLFFGAISVHAAPPGAVRRAAVDVARPLPPDLLQPESRTRWDLTAVPHGIPQAAAALAPVPERAALRPGERRVQGDEEAVTVGVGWVQLPSGPREAALLRVRRGNLLLHRWVDPMAGTVAEIGGPVSPDGTHRLAVTQGFVAASVDAPTAIAKIYVQETEGTPFDRVSYG